MIENIQQQISVNRIHSQSSQRQKNQFKSLLIADLEQLRPSSSSNKIKKQKIAKDKESHLMITDLAMHFDELNEFDPRFRNPQEQKQYLNEILGHKYRNFDMFILLLMLSILVPVISISFVYAQDRLTSIIYEKFVKERSIGNFFIALSFSLILIFMSVLICYYFKDADGSGIPQLKSLLAGVSIYKYLSFKIMFSKIIGLLLAAGAGLTIGREGPFVHISASVANNLSRFKFLNRLHQKNTFRKQILSTAAGKLIQILFQNRKQGIGITATFGAPIGGCLYSIETISTFFATNNFWKTMACSIMTAIIFHVYKNLIHLQIWFDTTFQEIQDPGVINYYINKEIFAFFFLGVVCGLVGVFQIKFIEWCIKFRKRITKNFSSRYFYTATVALFTLTVTYFYWPLNGERAFGFQVENTIEKLFTSKDYIDQDSFPILLIGLFLLKLIMNALAISCPVPAGIFVPMFLIGSLLGRIYGNIMAHLFHFTNIGRYSVVGAAALTSSVTHTIAIIVVAFEVTGQIVLLFPVTVGVMTSYIISRFMTVSIYHIIVEINNLPFLPKVLSANQYSKVAEDIMENKIPVLTLQSSFGEIGSVLIQTKFTDQVIPIVFSQSQPTLLYSIQTANLREYLKKEGKVLISKMPPKALTFRTSSVYLEISHQNNLNNIFENEDNNNNQFLKNVPHDMKDIFKIPKENEFWVNQIDIKNDILNVDQSPFTVLNTVSVVRLHFLFSMLGLHYVFVLNRGRFVGIISKESFTEKKD